MDNLKLEPLKLQRAKELKHGEVVYIRSFFDERIQKWRVNGNVKRWKRQPDRIQIPIKFGIYNFGYITNHNINLFEVEIK